MRILGELTADEVEAILPSGLIEALSADPADVYYCAKCDGLRTHTTADCTGPGLQPLEERPA